MSFERTNDPTDDQLGFVILKNHILGFYDPCLGEKKQLRIRYEFQKRMHEVVVADMEHVALPVRCKCLGSLATEVSDMRVSRY